MTMENGKKAFEAGVFQGMVLEKLSNIEDKQDSIKGEFDTHCRWGNETNENIDARLDDLETVNSNRRAVSKFVNGLAGAIGAAVVLAFQFIISLVGK